MQAYRSTLSEATDFTPHRVVFGWEMPLSIDVGTPIPEPPREIRTHANSLLEYFECSYQVAREVRGLEHRGSEGRYNERFVTKCYTPGKLVRIVQRKNPPDAPLKLNSKFSGHCEVLRVLGPVITL